MPESWYPFFEWCEGTALGVAVRESIYAFPLIEATHLVALCVMGGALLVVDLRLLGMSMKDQSIAKLAAGVRPWLVASLAVMLGTGVLLFLSEAIKCFYNTSFSVKIITLPFAIPCFGCQSLHLSNCPSVINRTVANHPTIPIMHIFFVKLQTRDTDRFRYTFYAMMIGIQPDIQEIVVDRSLFIRVNL